MSYYGSFVLQCYVLRMRVMTSTLGGNFTNRPPALRHIHVNKPNNMNKFLKCLFGIELYMFRTVSLCTIRSLVLYTQQ